MSNLSDNSWQILVTGVVQSVGFRPFVQRLAESMLLVGYVRNLGDAGVEIVLSCSEEILQEFILKLKSNLPELASINEVIVHSITVDISGNHFEIKPSDTKQGNSKGVSALPPDIAICDACIEDMKSHNKRKGYPFTSCTDCGPRFTAIIKLPYDRPNTSFNPFTLCDQCLVEYTTSNNRRFHAQTTCCITCGPQYLSYLDDGKWLQNKLDWEKITKSIANGEIWAIMGSGGTHYIVNALDIKAVKKLRKNRRKRSNKPFAVMMPDLKIVDKYCYLTEIDRKSLISKRRPIVILQSKDPSQWDLVSPNLNTLGVMLPYNGMQYNLFGFGTLEVIVMTSANLPGIPMPITKKGVFDVAKSIASNVLVHNLKIVQRVDDSVLRSHGTRHLIIRRSRGFTPQPFYNNQLLKLDDTIAVGAEETNTAAILKNGWIIPTQHLGHIINLESLKFQKDAINHLIDLYQLDPKVICRDLHPQFYTSEYARNLSEQYNIEEKNLFSVQHHVAHVASLSLDHNWDIEKPFLAWSCDGYGYGSDGQSWGAELIALIDNNWKRKASIIPIIYDGGDRNAIYPARMLVRYLTCIDENSEILLKEKADLLFSNGNIELNYLSNQSKRPGLMHTTSLGRLLDSISVLLGQTDKRTYRGEPAIKLEALASDTSSIESCIFVTKNADLPLLDNIELFRETFNLYKKGINKSSVARWVHDSIGKSLAEIGATVANDLDIKAIGFTGGVAYNKLITKAMENTLKSHKINLLIHNNIPPGDAGISIGQIYYVGRKLYE